MEVLWGCPQRDKVDQKLALSYKKRLSLFEVGHFFEGLKEGLKKRSFSLSVTL